LVELNLAVMYSFQVWESFETCTQQTQSNESIMNLAEQTLFTTGRNPLGGQAPIALERVPFPDQNHLFIWKSTNSTTFTTNYAPAPYQGKCLTGSPKHCCPYKLLLAIMDLVNDRISNHSLNPYPIWLDPFLVYNG
jgi:hypothetical protein